MPYLPPSRPALFVAVALWSFFSLRTAALTAAKPNILWLTSEDHGPHMGCYGDPLAKTPNVDALAARGMLFRHAWSVAPVCAPARTAIITGMYPTSLGAIHMRSMVPLPNAARLFPEYLREAGYYCTNQSKEDYNVPRTAATWDASNSKAHWKNRAPDQPFFAVFNSLRSHESQLRKRPHTAVTDPEKIRVPSYHPDTPEVRQDWAQYYDTVSEADADAGERIRELNAAGLADETIIFYFADHGSGMPRSKRWPGNSGLQVPLVIYFPEKWKHLAPKDYKPGGSSDRLVSFVDLAPTLLSIADVQLPAHFQGRAFAGPQATAAPTAMFGERGRMDESYDCIRSVSDGRFVYLRNFAPQVSHGQHVDYQFQTPTTRVWHAAYTAGKVTPQQAQFWQPRKAAEELYDLQTDPDEVVNLAENPDHAASVERFRTLLKEKMLSVRDVCIVSEGEMHERSDGRPPYDMARSPGEYPLERIIAAAGSATAWNAGSIDTLAPLLADPDSAVRYWAAIGHLTRRTVSEPLRSALADPSRFVRIAAAEAFARHGTDEDKKAAHGVLARELLQPDKGIFGPLAVLTALETLGVPDGPLRDALRVRPKPTPLTHERYAPYIQDAFGKLGLEPAIRGGAKRR
jgi:uncharacterized sulfatase